MSGMFFANLRNKLASYFSRSLAAPIMSYLPANASKAFVKVSASCLRLFSSPLRSSSRKCGKQISSNAKGIFRLQPTLNGNWIALAKLSPHMICARRFSRHATQQLLQRKLQLTKCTPALVQQQSVRNKCGRENCADPCDWPMCPPFNVRWPNAENKLHNIYESYWDEKIEQCCEDPCKWSKPHPRFDDIYLQESDKQKRRYMRTWNECRPIVKEKRTCCYDGTPPEICFRPKKERPQTACPPEPSVCIGNDRNCQKITMPGCCNLRQPQNCKPIVRGLLKCKKFCTPYPAFSECIKSKIKPPRQAECTCLRPVPMCEYYVYWRKRILSRSGEKC